MTKRSPRVISWNDVPLFFDIPYASLLLGLGYETVRKMVCSGIIPAVKIGDSWRIEKDQFKSWVEKGQKA